MILSGSMLLLGYPLALDRRLFRRIRWTIGHKQDIRLVRDYHPEANADYTQHMERVASSR